MPERWGWVIFSRHPGILSHKTSRSFSRWGISGNALLFYFVPTIQALSAAPLEHLSGIPVRSVEDTSIAFKENRSPILIVFSPKVTCGGWSLNRVSVLKMSSSGRPPGWTERQPPGPEISFPSIVVLAASVEGTLLSNRKKSTPAPSDVTCRFWLSLSLTLLWSLLTSRFCSGDTVVVTVLVMMLGRSWDTGCSALSAHAVSVTARNGAISNTVHWRGETWNVFTLSIPAHRVFVGGSRVTRCFPRNSRVLETVSWTEIKDDPCTTCLYIVGSLIILNLSLNLNLGFMIV